MGEGRVVRGREGRGVRGEGCIMLARGCTFIIHMFYSFYALIICKT